MESYSEFLYEKVYLYNTMFTNYSLIVDTYSGIGVFVLNIKGGYGEVRMEIQSYGSNGDEFIINIPSNLAKLDESESLFNSIINDIIYILNKNKLGYEFNINRFGKERSMDYYVIINSNKKISISDIERISQTTKIINSKIKDIDDFDKMVYYVK